MTSIRSAAMMAAIAAMGMGSSAREVYRIAGPSLPETIVIRRSGPNRRTSLGKWSRSNHDGRRAGTCWPGDGVKPTETRQMRAPARRQYRTELKRELLGLGLTPAKGMPIAEMEHMLGRKS